MITGDYSGDLIEGVRDGNGKLTWSNGDFYQGTFKNGLRHGRGTFEESKNGLTYLAIVLECTRRRPAPGERGA